MQTIKSGKKLLRLLMAGLYLALLFGCAPAAENTPPEPPAPPAGGAETPAPPPPAPAEEGKVGEYYPILQNVRYVYEGSGNEYAPYTVYIDYATDKKVQRRVDNGGTVLAEVITLEDGRLTRAYRKEESYARQNLLDAAGENPEVLLMEPIEAGTSWTLPDGRKRSIAGLASPVTTPLGNYSAVEVVTTGEGYENRDYYAKGVGLVKSVFSSSDMEVSSSLAKIEENTPFAQSVRFFFPDSDGNIYYVEKEISFKTNDITRTKLEAAYKEAKAANLQPVLTPGTKINSLYLNKDGMVYIDLSQKFLTELNAGSGHEQKILQSIADTFGYYYQADRVILTIDNALYESGHIALRKGEYLTAKADEAEKYS